ncbi:MAG: phosphopantetheine-binding protein [Pseudomonadota bacterium]
MKTATNAQYHLKQRNEIVEKIKHNLIDVLNLNFTPEQIHSDEILFGAGLNLDSIDSLQLVVSIKSSFDVEIKASDMWALRSVNTLADFIMKEKGMMDLAITNRFDNFYTHEKSLIGYDEIRNHMILYKNTEMCLLKLENEMQMMALNNILTKEIDFSPEGAVIPSLLLNANGEFQSYLYFLNNFDHYYLLFPQSDKTKVIDTLEVNEISFIDLTKEVSMLSLEGYESANVIAKLYGDFVAKMKLFSFSLESFNQKQQLVIRLDTNGETGFMLITLENDDKDLINTIVDSGVNFDKKPQQISTETEQLLWLESCRFHPNTCFLKNETIIAAGLSSLLSFDKETFLGKAAVETMSANQQLVHFQSDALIKQGELISGENHDIGYVIVSQYSPLLKKYVGNAYVAHEYANSGANLKTKESQIALSLVTAPQILGHSYLGAEK